jgi:DNA-binding CsgD family transcriptional regulator
MGTLPMVDDAKSLELVERIYDAAVDPALWPHTLLAITDAVGGRQVMMGLHDVECGALSVLAPRIDPAHLDSYRAHWGQHDILWRRTNRALVGEVLQAERYAPRDELLRTDFYQNWYRPIRIGSAGLGVNLLRVGAVPAVCGIRRAEGEDGFAADEVALFSFLAPHLVRAAKLQLTIARLTQTPSALRGRARAPALVFLDARGRFLDATEPAQRILAAGEGLRLVCGRVTARDPAAARQLAGQIAASLDARRRKDAPPAITILRGEGRMGLRVAIMPLRTRRRSVRPPWLDQGRALLVLEVRDLEREWRDAVERLRLRYGLTPAEGAVVAEIARGDGRAAAARRLGISPATLRTHLMRIFDKTDVHRQAKLVRLVFEEWQAD